MTDGEQPRFPPPVVAAGAVTAIVALGIVGWMVLRRRRERNRSRRQLALPDSVRGLLQGVGSRVRRVK